LTWKAGRENKGIAIEIATSIIAKVEINEMSKSTAVTKASDASVPVDPEQTLKACKALVAHIKKTASEPRDDGKPNLLADEETTIAETPVWLTLTTKKHIHDSHRM